MRPGTTSSRRRAYLWAFLTLLVVEILIGAFVRDAFVRPYVGDVLVVGLIYAFVRIAIPQRSWPLALKVALGVFLFACAIEVGQHFHLVDRLGLGHIRLARIVIGTGFSWWDIVAYAVGAALVLLVEAWPKE